MRKIYSFLLLLLCAIGMQAQQVINSVQGRPYNFGKAIVKAPEISYQDYSMDDIEFWVGEGSKRALFVVQFNDERETNALVWGYKFDGDKRGIDIIVDIAKADPRLYVLVENADAAMGYTICGIGFDADGDGDISLTHTPTGEIVTSNDGVFNTLGHYDYDDYKATDPDDYFGAGWYQSYWSYWVKDGNSTFSYSGLGASSRKLEDGSWDGWNFAVGMNPRDFKPFKAISAPGYTTGTFFIGNEASNGTVDYLNGKNEWETNIYRENNSGKKLEGNLLSGTLFGNNFYFVSEATENTKGTITVAESSKLTNVATLTDINGKDFAGVSPEKGYVSTDNGIYAIDLATMTKGNIVTGTNNNMETGKMIAIGKYVFALQKEKGILIIDSETDQVKETLTGNFVALAQTGDGNLWAASGDRLVKIDPASLLITNKLEIPAYAKISDNWSTWNAGAFIADPNSATLYWTNGGFFADSRSIYRYNPEENSSLASPFFTLPDEQQQFTAAGITMNAAKEQLVISATSTEDGSMIIYIVDAHTGVLLNKIEAPSNFPTPVFTLFPNAAPTITDIESSITVPVNSEPIKISLEGKINDTDNVNYNIETSVISENPELATAELKNGTLIISPQPDKSGKTNITLNVISNGKLTTKKIGLTLNRALEGIRMKERNVIMKAGSTKQLEVIFTPTDATSKGVTWKYESWSMANVDSKTGLVTAKKEGKTYIVATSAEGSFTDTCYISIVNEPLTCIKFEKEEINVYVNKEDVLNVIFTPEDASNKNLTWESEDATIASISSYNQKVSGKKAGTTKITATSKDGDFMASCTVNVTWNPATQIILDKKSVELQAPNTEQLNATFEPADASNSNVIWKSADEQIATVNTYGRITAVGAGKTIVTATSKDDETLADTCEVTCTFVPVESIAITTDTIVAVGRSVTLKKFILPEDASNKVVTWSSSKDTIATVSTYASVKGIKPGTAVITATTEDGNKTAVCNVKVVDTIHITSVTFAPTASIKVGKSVSPAKSYLPSNAYPTPTYTYKSDNEEIATVNKYGSIKGIAPGKVNVTIGIEGTKLTAVCAVEVFANPDNAAITPDSSETTVGNQLQFKANVLPVEALQNVTWESSDKSVATIDDAGIATALKAGETTITAICTDDKTIIATATLKVHNQPMTELTLDITQQSIGKGEGVQLTATALPENTTDKRVRWTTSDYTVATVTSYGYVKAIGLGNVTIHAVSQDGSNLSATCDIIVDKDPTGIDDQANAYSIYYINNELVIDNFEGYAFRLYTVSGEVLKQFDVTENHVCSNLKLAAGVYILKGNNGTRDIVTKIIIR